MARPLRLSFENAIYHVTARGNRRENIFYSDRDKSIFLDKIDETFEKYSFVCYAG
jgi:REP element-mobilizing transposase RayT